MVPLAYLVLFQLYVSEFHGITNAQVADVGRIFIGNRDPTTNRPVNPANDEYIFSSSNLTGQALPVYALVYRGTSLVPRTENITINCSVTSTSPGSSDVRISPVSMLATENSTQVGLSLGSSGRRVSVNCYAQSSSATCPVTVGGTQFCPDTSLSNFVFVTIRPNGTVSICEPEHNIKDNTCNFNVRLSEAATGDAVIVNCTSNGSLSLVMQNVIINIGGINGQVPCTAPNPTVGLEANVTCRASSPTGQFNFANTVPESTARFVVQANMVSFQPTWSQIYNTSFSSFLSLSGSVKSGSVSVSCQASVFSSVTDAQDAVGSPDCTFTLNLPTTAPTTSTTTTTTTTTTSTTTTATTSANGTSDNTTTSSATTVAPTTPQPTTPPDPNSPWRVVNSDFEISSNPTPMMFRPVTVERLREVIDVRTEIIVTTCCVRNSSSNSNYHGQSAVAVAVAKLAPYVCSKCNSTGITNPGSERVLQNPGFVEVAPCACDLTQNSCDINCCCDSVCTQNQRARFKGCIPGLAGGQAAEPQDYKCSSNAFNQPDWQLLTCVFWENNGYLGMFYMNRRKLTGIDEVSSEVQRTNKGRFSFSETERRFADEDSTLGDYQFGTIVQTGRDNVSVSGTLALSQPGPGAACNSLSPVRFLVEHSSNCRTVVTKDMCSALSVLSARVYAVSSTISGCSFKVLKTFKRSEIAVSDVQYYCLTNLTSVLPPTTQSLQDLNPTDASNFPDDLANVSCTDGCSDPTCWQYNSDRNMEAAAPLPPACTWDNGFTYPPVPSLVGSDCTNVVVDVRYNFEWRGHEIMKLSAIVILANISNVDNRSVEIVQKFSVNWLHSSNTTVTVSDNFLKTTGQYQRSGTAGYNLGKPLASGCTQFNSTTGQFDRVDIIPEKQMAIWRPGADGLCENAQRQQVTFGDDALSACALRLTFSDLNNTCDELRKLITNHLNVLMAADVVGRYGYNNVQDEKMWIPVMRQKLNLTNPELGSPTASTSNSTGQNVTSEQLFTWANEIAGVCLLPSAVNLQLLYAQTGASNGYPRLEVVGAYISYSMSNFSMDCMGVNQRRCDSSSTYTQNFILSSSVTFVQVPATLPTPQSRFYSRCDPDNFETDDSCSRYFTDLSTDECYYDSCWQQLAYPVLPAFLGDSQQYSLGFFLVLVLGGMGYVSVARPGWS